jgi:ABC-type polysaccharide/polyol phosphate transport system ATPase subunit
MQGEFFGILGRNGSGKSSLLKLLAEIYFPTEGKIEINEALTPFIELGVGFNPELTGRENVFLNGTILGLSEKQIHQKYNTIVKFAELERFMDQKLKNYSSGMQVRLAFSIAIQAQNPILLIDEVLAVGDERFQTKCLKVFEEIKKDPSRTIVFVSHDMASVQKFCDRVAVIHDGELKFVGNTDEGTLLYKQLNFPELMQTEKYGDSDSRVKIEITDAEGKERKSFQSNEEMHVNVSFKDHKLASKVKNAGISVYRDDDQYICGQNTLLDNFKLVAEKGFRYRVKLNLGTGHYYLKIGLFGDSTKDIHMFSERTGDFIVNGSPKWEGITNLVHHWAGKE